MTFVQCMLYVGEKEQLATIVPFWTHGFLCFVLCVWKIFFFFTVTKTVLMDPKDACEHTHIHRLARLGGDEVL